MAGRMKRLARMDFAAPPPEAGLSAPMLVCGLCALALAALLQGSTRSATAQVGARHMRSSVASASAGSVLPARDAATLRA
jgi:hypothetical protein